MHRIDANSAAWPCIIHIECGPLWGCGPSPFCQPISDTHTYVSDASLAKMDGRRCSTKQSNYKKDSLPRMEKITQKQSLLSWAARSTNRSSLGENPLMLRRQTGLSGFSAGWRWNGWVNCSKPISGVETTKTLHLVKDFFLFFSSLFFRSMGKLRGMLGSRASVQISLLLITVRWCLSVEILCILWLHYGSGKIAHLGLQTIIGFAHDTLVTL